MNLDAAPSFDVLVPCPAPSLRSSRYQGEDRGVPLSAMPEVDRRNIRALYQAVSALHFALGESEDVERALASFPYDDVTNLARRIGREAAYPDEPTRQALHDVRGGALTSLALLAYRERRKQGSVSARSLRILAADHLKVMRNAVLELDDAQREEDMALRPHSIDRLVATLERVASDTAEVRVTCSFQGAISMSCMELGTLDRAVLNVANNAVRHAARDPVGVWLLPVRERAQPDLRVLIVNAISRDHSRLLEERLSGELSRLFVERFSTTGSGEGMHLCAELAAAAYGLTSADDAVRAGIVGARLVGEDFLVWLHWPAVV